MRKISSPEGQTFPKSDEASTQRFYQYLLDFPEAEPRKMFGQPCGFVRGQMFACLFNSQLMLRLDENGRAQFSAEVAGARHFEPMPGRVMREYMAVPEELYIDPEWVYLWMERAYRYALALPPKLSKKKK